MPEMTMKIKERAPTIVVKNLTIKVASAPKSVKMPAGEKLLARSKDLTAWIGEMIDDR